MSQLTCEKGAHQKPRKSVKFDTFHAFFFKVRTWADFCFINRLYKNVAHDPSDTAAAWAQKLRNNLEQILGATVQDSRGHVATVRPPTADVIRTLHNRVERDPSIQLEAGLDFPADDIGMTILMKEKLARMYRHLADHAWQLSPDVQREIVWRIKTLKKKAWEKNLEKKRKARTSS